MPVVFASKVSPRPWLVRRSVAVIGGIAVAAALSVATLSNSRLARAVGEGVADGFHNMVTVAAMLAERSPGDRPAGALANLKPKRQRIHERALPKVRGPVTSPTPYEALVGTPPNPVIAPPPEAPLHNVVAGGPAAVIPLTGGAGPGAPGGPPILSDIPAPGGSGGFTPPVTTVTQEVPPTPTTPVPEPGTWAMMLLGFALIGRALRRNGVATMRPTAG